MQKAKLVKVCCQFLFFPKMHKVHFFALLCYYQFTILFTIYFMSYYFRRLVRYVLRLASVLHIQSTILCVHYTE